MAQRNLVHMLLSEYELKTLEEASDQALRVARELQDDTAIAIALQYLQEIADERTMRNQDDRAPF